MEHHFTNKNQTVCGLVKHSGHGTAGLSPAALWQTFRAKSQHSWTQREFCHWTERGRISSSKVMSSPCAHSHHSKFINKLNKISFQLNYSQWWHIRLLYIIIISGPMLLILNLLLHQAYMHFLHLLPQDSLSLLTANLTDH